MTSMIDKDSQPERLALNTSDLTETLLAQLRTSAPYIFSEGRVDFTKLQAALGEHINIDPERYGLSWAGKRDAFRNVQVPSVATLRPQLEESVNWESTGNIIIEGDNLEVLKLLQKSYHGKVKMIYIDPPYNTGNEFIYPDNFREGLEEYLRYTGQLSEDGTAVSTNKDTSGRYHSNWLNMMYPRLFLARNLLRENGVIFVNIDDHEVHNLRLLMDEVFGEENFIANIVWQKRYVSNVTAKFLSDMHDYVLVYARSAESVSFNLVERTEDQLADYKNPDNDPRGPWRAQDLSASKYYSAGQFEITTPSGQIVHPPPGRYWRCNQNQYNEWVRDGRIWFGKSGLGRPMLKAFLSEVQQGITPNTWWDHEFSGHNKEATLETKELFDGASPFDTSKPVRLIRRMLQLSTNQDKSNDSEQEEIILDFFAGSGTTAHAVLEANEEDGVKRKFILVQLPEKTDNPQYPTIAHITRERVRRVIAKLNDADAARLNLDAMPAPNSGFRAFKLDASNFKIWRSDMVAQSSEGLAEQLNLYADNVQPNRSEQDRLYELILKSGLPLSSIVESFSVGEYQAYSVGGDALVICLESHLSRELLRELMVPSPAAQRSAPQTILCLDSAFDGNDALKTNALLEARSHGITFRTV